MLISLQNFKEMSGFLKDGEERLRGFTRDCEGLGKHLVKTESFIEKSKLADPV
jgi:hypothetical protein